MEYKIRANNQKEAVEVYKAIRQIQQGKHNIAVNADSRKDAVRIYKEAKRVCDSKIKDVRLEKGDWFTLRNSRYLYKVVNVSQEYLVCEIYYMYYDYNKKLSLRNEGRKPRRIDNKDLKLNAVRFNSAGEALDWAYRQAKINSTFSNILKKGSSFKSAESSKQGKLATDSKKVKDEDYKLMRAIIDICKKYNYYTYGTLDDYNKLLNRADKMDLVDIATNISVHSDENDSRKIEQILKKELASRGIVVKDSGSRNTLFDN